MEKRIKFAMIAAACRNNGIGINGKLPWRLKNEMAFFTRITTDSHDGKQNAVIMGRKTWESIPTKYRPLAKRINAIISSSLSEKPSGAHHLFPNLSEALLKLSDDKNIDTIFIIGGESLYREGIQRNECEKIYLTRVDADFECDVFFPQVDPNCYQTTSQPNVPTEEQEEAGIRYNFFVYERTQHEPHSN